MFLTEPQGQAPQAPDMGNTYRLERPRCLQYGKQNINVHNRRNWEVFHKYHIWIQTRIFAAIYSKSPDVIEGMDAITKKGAKLEVGSSSRIIEPRFY